MNDTVSGEWVTPAVARWLSSEGVFTQVAADKEYDNEVTAAHATAVGTKFLRGLSSDDALGRAVAAEHGKSVPFDELYVCGRVTYLRSAFEQLGDGTVTERTLTSFIGGQWLATYCAKGVVVVVQTVAATIQARIEGDTIAWTPNTPVAVTPFGVSGGSAVIQSAERAVGIAFAATGVRISELPTTLHDITSIGPITASNGRPLGAFWKLTLERPVAFVWPGSAEVRHTSTVYVPLGYTRLPHGTAYVAGPDALAPFSYTPRIGAPDTIHIHPRDPLNLVEFRPPMN